MISEYDLGNNKSQYHGKATLIKIKNFLTILSCKIGATVTELGQRAPGETCFTFVIFSKGAKNYEK